MSILQSLQNALKEVAGPQGRVGSQKGGLLGGIAGKVQDSNLLGPALLGGLVGVLATSKTARAGAGGALAVGAGAYLWNKYKDRMSGAVADPGPQGQPVTECTKRAERLIRALVFAAKSDGHIDPDEERNILREVEKLNLGPEGQALVQGMLSEPLDPEALARGVESPEEALEIYSLSCAVISIDTFMERSYMDALARALNIPEDVKKEIEGGL